MAQYIDADAATELARLTYCKDCNSYNGVMCRACAFDDAMSFIDDFPEADVAPRAEEGAECPTCHGTGRIGTTDWLTKHLSKKQLAEEKAKAIAEHEGHIKAEAAREIFEEINAIKKEYASGDIDGNALYIRLYQLEKKYTEEQK